MPFSLCQRYSGGVSPAAGCSRCLALHPGPRPVVVLLVGLPVLAPVLLAGVELLQLHLVHVVRDPHLLPRGQQGLQLRKLVCRKPVFLGKDDLWGTRSER